MPFFATSEKGLRTRGIAFGASSRVMCEPYVRAERAIALGECAARCGSYSCATLKTSGRSRSTRMHYLYLPPTNFRIFYRKAKHSNNPNGSAPHKWCLHIISPYTISTICPPQCTPLADASAPPTRGEEMLDRIRVG